MNRTFHIKAIEVRFNWLIALCVLIVAAGLVRLGIWQMSRAQEQLALQESYLELGQGEATPIANVPVAGLTFDAIQHQSRRVVMTGHYLHDQTIFLIYQTYEDHLGFEVVTPFAVSGLDQNVMVSRGWSGITDSERLWRNLPRPAGEITLEGQIYVPTEKQAARASDIQTVAWPLIIRYLNMGEVSALFDTGFFPYVVRLNEGQPGVLVRHWPEVIVNTGRHYSYALQWFAMAGAVLIVSLLLASNILPLLQDRWQPP